MEACLRAALPADIPALLEIEAACFSHPWTEAQLLRWMQPDHLFLVCVREQTVLGYCNAQLVLDTADIGNVAVSPAARRRGLAARLLRELEHRAAAQGVTQLQLELRAGNTPALALYEKSGYLSVGRRKNYYRDPKEDAILMTKFLKKKEEPLC